MNKYVLVVTIVAFGALAIGVAVGLKYSQATLFFGLIAAFLAPVVIHKIPSVGLATGMLIGLAVFASFPLKKLFQIDGFINEALLNMAYAALLWVIGFGWRRSWR